MTVPDTPRGQDAAEDELLCALVQRITTGDEQALGQLYDRTVSRIYSAARQVTRNLQCAEEVTEDVYWQAWRQALRYDRGRGTVMAWLLTLARSRALDHLRRADEALSHPEPTELVDDAGDADATPTALAARREAQQRLESALERLDPLPRQLIALAFLRGLTHDEIARQTALPLGTVKSHIRRALLVLRELLGPIDGARAVLT
jgi:RNA polymerase sigma factor (sigma-70 family)